MVSPATWDSTPPTSPWAPEPEAEASPALAMPELFHLISCLVPTKHPVLFLMNGFSYLWTLSMPIPMPWIPFSWQAPEDIQTVFSKSHIPTVR